MTESPPARSMLGRLRARVLSGLVVLVPLFLTIWVLRAILRFLASLTLPFFGTALAAWPPLAREALAALIVLAVLYVLGEITAMVVGRRLVGLGEAMLLRVPLARVIYGASKQVVEAFQTTQASQFSSVVAIDFPQPGFRSLGFLTGRLDRPGSDPLVTVFVPTTPNPTTGFLQILPASQATELDMSVEDAIKMIMSLGVLAPKDLGPTLLGGHAMS